MLEIRLGDQFPIVSAGGSGRALEEENWAFPINAAVQAAAFRASVIFIYDQCCGLWKAID